MVDLEVRRDEPPHAWSQPNPCANTIGRPPGTPLTRTQLRASDVGHASTLGDAAARLSPVADARDRLRSGRLTRRDDAPGARPAGRPPSVSEIPCRGRVGSPTLPAIAPAGPPVLRHDRRTRCSHDRDRGPPDRPDPRPPRRRGHGRPRRAVAPRRPPAAPSPTSACCTSWSAASCGCSPTWRPGPPADEAERTADLTRHADLIGRVLLHHHTVEREAVWPALLRAVPAARTGRERVDDWTARCARIDHMLRDVSTAARQWQVACTAPARDAFAIGLPVARRRRRRPDRRRGAHAAPAARRAPRRRGLGGDRRVGALPALGPRAAVRARPGARGLLRRRPRPPARRPAPVGPLGLAAVRRPALPRRRRPPARRPARGADRRVSSGTSRTPRSACAAAPSRRGSCRRPTWSARRRLPGARAHVGSPFVGRSAATVGSRCVAEVSRGLRFRTARTDDFGAPLRSHPRDDDLRPDPWRRRPAWYWHRAREELRAPRPRRRGRRPARRRRRRPAWRSTPTRGRGRRRRRAVSLVAQSMGGFTAPLVCARLPVDLIVLVNAMIPRARGDRRRVVGRHRPAAMREMAAREGRARATSTTVRPLPARRPPGGHRRGQAPASREQSGTPVRRPLAAGRLARRPHPGPGRPRRPLLPGGFQRRVAAERLGITLRRDARRSPGRPGPSGRGGRPARGLPRVEVGDPGVEVDAPVGGAPSSTLSRVAPVPAEARGGPPCRGTAPRRTRPARRRTGRAAPAVQGAATAEAGADVRRRDAQQEHDQPRAGSGRTRTPTPMGRR